MRNLSVLALMLVGLFPAVVRPASLPADERAKVESAVPRKASVQPKKPRKVLVVTLKIRDGKQISGHASIPHANLAIQLMGENTGAYEAVFSNDLENFRPEKLAEFDAICFNNTGGVLTDDPALQLSLLNFVASGKGFIGFHAAVATFVQFPEYGQFLAFGEMIGAHENGGHPWKPHDTITLRVEDPDHPVNAAFAGKGFEVADEVFQFMDGHFTRNKLRVLLSIDPAKTDMGPDRGILPERRRDLDFPISWVKQYGRGRVFYTGLGHNPHIWWNEPILRHFLDGIQFALGDLEADTTPSVRPPGN